MPSKDFLMCFLYNPNSPPYYKVSPLMPIGLCSNVTFSERAQLTIPFEFASPSSALPISLLCFVTFITHHYVIYCMLCLFVCWLSHITRTALLSLSKMSLRFISVVYQWLIPFYWWVVFPCVEMPKFAYPFTSWKTSGLFPIWGDNA